VAGRGSAVTIVVDASVVTSALLGTDKYAGWAAGVLSTDFLVAPHAMPAEVTSSLRRGVLAGRISQEAGSLACADLLELSFSFAEFGPLGHRVWQMRDAVSAYDAWYVALAEQFDAPLATLDRRLVGAPGPRCEFLTPDS
jgi:predicted nucleic acid-binding protein